MLLSELAQRVGLSASLVHGEAELSSIEIDSRRVTPGALFVCMPSERTDSHQFLGAARDAGAVAAVVYSAEGLQKASEVGLSAVYLARESYPDSIWRLADEVLSHPTRSMKVFAVTGTNGKTTTAWLIRDLLVALGHRAGYLGTLGFDVGEHSVELQNTTPFAVELTNHLAKARDLGADSLAIEVSSHALAERRADGLEVDVAVFTNLTQDHLDFHGTMANYEAAKWRLFTDFRDRTAKGFATAVNVDDPTGERWAVRLAQLGTPCLTYGRDKGHLTVAVLALAVDHLELVFKQDGGTAGPVRVGLGGDYNISNTESAVAALVAGGFDLGQVVSALPKVRPVPGRFEPVANETGRHVVVDYAHTPDALVKLLDTVRSLTAGRVISVFGCGGDRDRTKRPLMARAASERSDITIVTSDNPRTEDPQSILDEVVLGIEPGRDYRAVVDRPEAIALAIELAQPGDVVVIAGKGHETYQIIGRTKYPMDDRELARKAMENLR